LNPIEIENLQKVYVKGLKQQKVVAVNDLTLAVEEGEIFGFVGPNGAGKTSTIKIICHLLRATSGRVTLMGMDVSLAKARKQVGYLPENPSYYDYLTGEEMLAFNGTIHGMKPDRIRERSKELLGFVELEDSARRPIRTYSKGMVQRVGIAAALIHDPRVLIFDEPMSGLDPIGRRLVMDLMLQLRAEGKTIFFSTHILADVESICDRIGVIVEGKLVYEGSMEAVRSSAIRHYELVFSADAAEVSRITWPGDAVPERRADLYVLAVEPDYFEATMKILMERGFKVNRIEPKRERLEDIFVDLAGNK
jgi:ABC-2 type transport system ATP-binding protein